MNRRAFLLVIMMSLLCGCFSKKIDRDSRAGLHKQFVGYGDVNHWYEGNISKKLDLLVKYGVGCYSIEFFGWGESDKYAVPDELEKKWQELVQAARARRVTVMVSIVNDNKGLGKYGDNKKRLAEYRSQLERAVEIIAATGPERILVQPVGETRTETGRWFDGYCVDKLAPLGFELIYNGGSRPRNAPHGFHAFAYHPATTSSTIPQGAIVVTDHSRILSELQKGGLYGYAKPEQLELYAKKCISDGHSFIYYGFAHKQVDVDALKALAKVL